MDHGRRGIEALLQPAASEGGIPDGGMDSRSAGDQIFE
jgi:hypothetical protein